MLNRIIDLTLAYRWLVLVGILALLAAGGYALYTIPVEAFPDLTNNQVVVVTDAPSLPPTEVEQLVTYPIERAMLGLPNKEEVRSLSKLGLSMVTVVFDDSVPMYFARQLVSERLQQISSQLPRGSSADAGPAGDGVRRAVPVHALRADERDGAEGSARVGDQAAAAHASRRQRNQYLGRTDQAVPDRRRSGAARCSTG